MAKGRMLRHPGLTGSSFKEYCMFVPIWSSVQIESLFNRRHAAGKLLVDLYINTQVYVDISHVRTELPVYITLQKQNLRVSVLLGGKECSVLDVGRSCRYAAR